MTQHSSPSNPRGSSVQAWIARTALLSALTVAAGCGSSLTPPGSVAASANAGAAPAASTIAGDHDRAPADTDSHDADPSAASGRAQSSQCSSVQQYGITFAFDRQYPCGRFANGDYWVAPVTGSSGKVKIVSISPDFSADHNGFEVNPSRVDRHGFDGNAVGYDATLVPTLPYSASANQSIVKAISLANDDKTALDTAAVLTVLAAAPPDGGGNSFRPPYFGRNKPLYSVGRLRLDRLPAYPALPDMPSLSSLSQDYARVQLDHQLGWMADQIHPKQNMPDYGAQIAIDAAAASLRLMVRGDAAERRQLAIHLVQYGIDLDAAMQGGLHFHADGGHRHGRKLILALSALLLDDPAMAARVRDFQQGTFQEDDQLYVGAGSGTVLFGSLCSAAEYWENQNTGNGSRDCRDPYGYIDGGQKPGDYYQLCCTAMGYKAAALALRLMPQLRCIWTDDRILRYADRWVQHGTWTQPDPYQPRGNGARDSNPADGIGRWPRQHGAARNDGYYGSDFADAMWSAYRAQASDTYSCP